MKKVVIYSRTVCPYCDMAKNLLTQKGVQYEEKNAESDEHVVKFMELAQKYSHMTVPMIFIGDEFVGGFDDLNALNNSGELDKKLA